MKVLHVTHTNLDYDYRIQREMRAVNKFPFVTEVYGLGVFFDEGAAKDNFELDYKNMYLLGRRMPHVYSTNFLRQVFTFCNFCYEPRFL